MILWVTALIFVGGATAAVFFVCWIAWRKRRSRTAPDVRADSVAHRRVVDVAAEGLEATGPGRYPAAADAARRPSGASTWADRAGQWPGGQRGTAPQASPPIATPPGSTSAGTVLRWSYQGPGRGEVAGTGNATGGGSLRPIVGGVGPPPPEVAATLRNVVSEFSGATAALPGDFAQLSGKAQIRCMAGVAKQVPGHWLPAGAATSDLDLPAERTNWTWTVFFEPGPTPGPQSSTRSPRSTDQKPAGHGRPDTARAGDAQTDNASDPGRNQTVILLDAAVLDTLIAVLLPSSHGVNYNDPISVIKISIQPRMLVIKSVTLTVGAILNAHGLGVLAPAFGRITTKILVPTLNLLLGPDCRHDKLMKSLDLLDFGLYAANGRPTDSPTFRRNLSNWVAGAHGDASRPDAPAYGRRRPKPHFRWGAPSHSRRPESGPDGRSAPWSDVGSPGRRPYSPRTSPSSADGPAGAPPHPGPANQAGAASPGPTSPARLYPVGYQVAGSADPQPIEPISRSQEPVAWPGPTESPQPPRSTPGPLSAQESRPPRPVTSGRPGVPPVGPPRAVPPAGRRRAAGTETPGAAAPPRHQPLPSRRPRRQGPPAPTR